MFFFQIPDLAFFLVLSAIGHFPQQAFDVPVLPAVLNREVVAGRHCIAAAAHAACVPASATHAAAAGLGTALEAVDEVVGQLELVKAHLVRVGADRVNSRISIIELQVAVFQKPIQELPRLGLVHFEGDGFIQAGYVAVGLQVVEARAESQKVEQRLQRNVLNVQVRGRFFRLCIADMQKFLVGLGLEKAQDAYLRVGSEGHTLRGHLGILACYWRLLGLLVDRIQAGGSRHRRLGGCRLQPKGQQG